MTNNTPLNADDEIDAVLEQAFTDGASDTMWQNDRHVEIFAEAKRRLLADRKKHELQAKKNGFYMAAGLFGLDISRVEELWDKCEQELEKL